MINYIKRNAIVLGYIFSIITDSIFEISKNLDLTTLQLNWLKVGGVLVAMLAREVQLIVSEKE